MDPKPRSARKMVGIDLTEASGVDMPAHLQEGWLVLKSLNPSLAEEVLAEARALRKADEGDEGGDDEPEDESQPEPTEPTTEPAAETTAPDEPDEPQPDEPEPDQPDPDEPDPKDTTMTELEQAQARIAELEGKLAGVSKSAEPTDEFEAVYKSLPEPVRKRLAEYERRVVEAEAVAKAERDVRLDAEYLEKAKEFRHLPTEATVLAKHLRTVAETTPDAYAELTRVLKAANAQAAESSLYKELGSNRTNAEGESAQAKLEALAREQVSKSTSGLEFADAYAAVLKSDEGAALYRQYQLERANR